MFEEAATLKMDDSERQCLGKIANAARRMGLMIDGLLTFSRVGSASMSRFEVPMDGLVKEIIAGISQNLNNRHIEWKTDPLPVVLGDVNLLRQVWSNLLNNAVKYTRPRDPAKIEIGSELQLNEVVYYVRDNGVGFEMEFAEKLFSVFNRLHSEKDFEGTGMGLANVRRIIQRHGGRTWVDAKLNEGATFFFSLPE
jgi:light-regulated signal transduction histidine kinase (bacteriophytochrome)